VYEPEQSAGRPLKVGIYLLPWTGGMAGETPRWTDVLAMAERVEALGFDSLWVSDHFLHDFPDEERQGPWEGWSMLSALAARTSRVTLGTNVMCTSFRNPALLAKMADTVDEISDGRLVLGVGAGWHEPEYRAIGEPFDHRVSRFEEALQIITGLLRDGAIDFDGRYYSARECELRPRGPRRGGPPIMVGSRGPRMLRLLAKHADWWNGGWANRASDVPARVSLLEDACDDTGRDPGGIVRTTGVMVDMPGVWPHRGRDWATKLRARVSPLSGTPDDIAGELRAMSRHGIQHVQVWLDPLSVTGIEAFAPVLDALDRNPS
jgi:probable F420-dependent oxidoreductase